MVGILIRFIIVAAIIFGILLWYNTADQEGHSHENTLEEVELREGDDAPDAAASHTPAEKEEKEESFLAGVFAKDTVKTSGSDIEKDSAVAEFVVPVKKTQKVPFIVQAPEGQWEEPQFQDACEEASLLMTHLWLTGGESPSKKEATEKLQEIIAFVQKTFGDDVIDTSSDDTARIFTEFYGSKIRIEENMELDDMFTALAKDSLIIVPTDGRALGNPYFSGEGPERHMLVITGYDRKKGLFFTNDPGTKRGMNYAYKVSTLYNAVRDYPTGNKVPIERTVKKMLIVER